MALWGNKNDDDPDRPVSQNGDSSSHVVQPRASEADERTRLLPPPSQGYLSPDDPAVSSSSSAFLWLLNRPSEEMLTLLPGIALQSMERSIFALLYGPLRNHNLPMVGAVTGIHFCQSTRNALSWIRFLRLLIHDPHTWTSDTQPAILLLAI